LCRFQHPSLVFFLGNPSLRTAAGIPWLLIAALCCRRLELKPGDRLLNPPLPRPHARLNATDPGLQVKGTEIGQTCWGSSWAQRASEACFLERVGPLASCARKRQKHVCWPAGFQQGGFLRCMLLDEEAARASHIFVRSSLWISRRRRVLPHWARSTGRKSRGSLPHSTNGRPANNG
jgi:hypothetical protein